MAYIDLELLTEKLHKKLADCSLNKKIKKTLAFIEMCDAIKECPKIDIVQCKDCKHYKPYNKPVEDFDGECIVRECETDENEFCSYGERRVEGNG